MVPPLLYINMVENAFKYGVSAGKSFIHLSLRVDAEEGLIRFRSQNLLPPEGRDSLADGEHTGVGLRNLGKRLHYIYGENCRFTTGPQGPLYVAELDIPLQHKQKGNPMPGFVWADARPSGKRGSGKSHG